MKKQQKVDRKHSKISVFFATFSPYENNKRLPTNGMVEGTLAFFVPRVKRFLLVIEPHPGSDQIDPIIEKYEYGKLIIQKNFSRLLYFPLYFLCKFQKKDKTYVSYKLRDFISVFVIGLTEKKTYDLFIGLESVHTLVGIILRKLRKVKKVVYRVSDYSPNRYSNPFFNFVYLWLDRFCAMHADYIWDVSPAMQPARVKAGLGAKKSAPNFVVPNALLEEQIAYLPIEKRMPYSLVYMGTLHYVNGPDLAIEAMPIVKKRFPKVKLHIVGGGEENMKRLKKLVQDLRLSDYVVFHGFIVDNIEMAKFVRTCYVALAPYRDIERSFRSYADATKIRQYLGSGLPVVTTHVPPLGKQIIAKSAGLAVKDTKEELAKAIIKILSDKKLYGHMYKNAVALSKDNTWEHVYTRALREIHIDF